MIYGSKQLELTSEFSQVKTVTSEITAICKEIGLTEQESGQITLAVGEAINNVIEHAYKCAPGRPIKITISYNQFVLDLIISDEGETFKDFSPRKELDFDPDDLLSLPEGGMGLFLITSIMDNIEYSSSEGVNTLHLSKNITRVSDSEM